MTKKLLFGALLVVLVSVAVESAAKLGWLEASQHWYYDVWHQLAGRRYQPEQVVIVALDDQTWLEHQEEPLVFWSPYFAQALKVLRQVGARTVGLDLLFSVSAESWLKRLKLPDSEQSRTYDLPFREQLASGPVVLAGKLVIDFQGKRQVLLPLADYWGSLPGKLDDLGLVNFYNDPDGVIRRFIPALAVDEDEVWVTFGKLLAERGAPGAPAAEPSGPESISFAGPPGTIPRISFRRLLREGAESDPEIRGLKNKIVIIASEISGQQDVVLTPYARGFITRNPLMMSGAELHGNIVETLLRGRAPRPVPALVRVLYLMVMLAVGGALFFSLPALPGLAAGVLLGLAGAGLGFSLFRADLLLPVAEVQLGLLLSYLGILGFRLTGEERERARLRQIFGRYVSEEVVEKLLVSGQPDLGGEALEVTVLFADIRNFTTISESLNAHEVVEMLNEYFSRVCEPILRQGGTVDKFIGDAVMALFGSPVPHADHARRALGTALEMTQVAREFSAWMEQRFADRSLPEFNIGVGLHTGEAVVGNIGSPKRLEFTSIGDTVNLASRLEGLTKELGWQIVASRETVTAAGPGVVTGRRESLQVKGRQEAVEVLEILGLNGD
ncbi:MAG: adenylate/guanylate cyclase domain-containing protein [Thermodesulfobacteriota bacterium]